MNLGIEEYVVIPRHSENVIDNVDRETLQQERTARIEFCKVLFRDPEFEPAPLFGGSE